MNENFKNTLFYPEFFTHQSIRLANAPAAADVPATGYMYVWYTYVQDSMYMNIKLDDGTVKNCPMFEQIQEKITLVTPDALPPLTFAHADISSSVVQDRKILVVNNNYAIAQVFVYTTNLHQEKVEVSCPIFSDGTSTYLDLTDVNSSFLQYGGQVVYAQGTVVNFGTEDNPYIIPTANGSTDINALNGLYQSIQSITDELIITASNIKNLAVNKTIKIYVKNTSEANVLICNECVVFDRFFVMFGNFEGNIFQIGKAVNISNGI